MSKHCKCKAAECEECPEWIFTFADLVMLMMGFFVILWVLKPAPGEEKKEGEVLPIELVAKIREAFDYLPDPSSKDPVDVYMILKKLEKIKPMMGEGLGGQTKVTRKGAEGTDPQTRTVRQGKQSVLGARIGFGAGSGELAGDAHKNLDQIAELIKGHFNIVLVKGHTALDDFPESADPATIEQQRMDLSLRRAKTVSDYLTAHGVSASTLRVQGCSTFEPVAQQAYSDDARTHNRRVEVEGTDSLVSDRQDPSKAATTRPVGTIYVPERSRDTHAEEASTAPGHSLDSERPTAHADVR